MFFARNGGATPKEGLKPAFNASYGVVYVLPEVKSLAEVFPAAHELALRQGATGSPAS